MPRPSDLFDPGEAHRDGVRPVLGLEGFQCQQDGGAPGDRRGTGVDTVTFVVLQERRKLPGLVVFKIFLCKGAAAFFRGSHQFVGDFPQVKLLWTLVSHRFHSFGQIRIFQNGVLLGDFSYWIINLCGFGILGHEVKLVPELHDLFFGQGKTFPCISNGRFDEFFPRKLAPFLVHEFESSGTSWDGDTMPTARTV